jgi:hypothetical protein
MLLFNKCIGIGIDFNLETQLVTMFILCDLYLGYSINRTLRLELLIRIQKISLMAFVLFLSLSIQILVQKQCKSRQLPPNTLSIHHS